MAWESGGVVAILTVCAETAAAGDRPIFEFKGQVPVPGGTARLDARCAASGEVVHCLAEGRGPSERGFDAEEQIFVEPQAPAAPDPSRPLPCPPPRF